MRSRYHHWRAARIRKRARKLKLEMYDCQPRIDGLALAATEHSRKAYGRGRYNLT